MKNKIIFLLISTLSASSFSYAWGTKTSETNQATKTIVKPNANKTVTNTNDSQANNLSTNEKKLLVLNKLKSSNPRATNIAYDGSTIPLNIPLYNPTIINLPEPIAEMFFVQGNGIELIEDPLATKSNILKIRSISPLLHEYELQLRLINNEWVRLKISTNLKNERFSKINIITPSDKEVNLQALRSKYFSRKYNVKNITRKENVKAVNLIVDRLDTESKKHSEQVEIEEKINKFIIKNDRFGLFLKSSVVEPFEVVSEYKPNANTIKSNKEVILLNIDVFNFGEKYLELTTPFIKNIFKNYIAFWYDFENAKIAPNSSAKLIIVIEDINPEIN